MKKKKRAEITEREQKAREKWKQQQAERRAKGQDGDSMSAAEAARLIDVLDTAEARDAALSLADWRALTECQRTTLWENSQDLQSAHGMPLADYRREKRRRIEAGEMTGFPSWLRDEYAAERPVEIAVEYLGLLRALEHTTGPAQKEIIRKITERVWRGWIVDRSPEEARTLLLEEINRAGLREIFNEARDQSELQRILNS